MYLLLLWFFVCVGFFCSSRLLFQKIENYINKRLRRNGTTESVRERERAKTKRVEQNIYFVCVCVLACDLMIHKQWSGMLSCWLAHLYSKSKTTFILIEAVNVSICVYVFVFIMNVFLFLTTQAYGFVFSFSMAKWIRLCVYASLRMWYTNNKWTHANRNGS